MKTSLTTLIWMALLILSACRNSGNDEKNMVPVAPEGGTVENAAEPVKGPPSSLDFKYQLLSFTYQGENQTIPQDETITLNLSEGIADGNAGCNQFRGAFTVDEAQLLIRFSNIAKSKKVCDGIMGREDKILQLLSDAQSYNILGTSLLQVKSETGLLYYKRI